MSANWDDKPVGYKEPPKWTQFQKGRSGNPRGRPKKAKPAGTPAPAGSSLLDDALREERDRMVTVSLMSGSQDIRMYDAVIRKMAACAAKGDVHAQKAILGTGQSSSFGTRNASWRRRSSNPGSTRASWP
jgi:hypothetical protein